jgi:hypothetical protein
MSRNFLILFIAVVLSGEGYAQSVPDYKARMGQIMWNIQKSFYEPSTGLFVETNGKNEKPHSYLWPLCALLQAADEVETVLPGKQYMKPVQGTKGFALL